MSCEEDAAALDRILKARDIEAHVWPYHGVSVRLRNGTYLGLHTKDQFSKAMAAIDAGGDPLEAIRANSG